MQLFEQANPINFIQRAQYLLPVHSEAMGGIYLHHNGAEWQVQLKPQSYPLSRLVADIEAGVSFETMSGIRRQSVDPSPSPPSSPP
jgi:hypothetical protein